MLKIIYEDDDIIVVVKPAGMESQASGGFGSDMVSEIKKHLAKAKKGDNYVAVVHRLDKPVAGIMVYAKTKEAAAGLSSQFAKAGHADKIYTALCRGKMTEKNLRLIDKIVFDKASNKSYIISSEESEKSQSKQAVLNAVCLFFGKASETTGKFKSFDLYIGRLIKSGVLSPDEDVSLCEIELETGRHHQIRVQMSNAGFPVLGDTKYDELSKNYRGLSSLCLFASRLTIKHPVTGKEMAFEIEKI